MSTRPIAIVTGASSGIGLVAARALAVEGYHVYMACRNEAKTAPLVDDIRAAAGHDQVEFLALDLASLDSVRACAAAFLALEQPLSLLVNNAGLGDFREVTEDGFEKTFGVNHLGHFLLTLLLMPALERGEPSRVVNVASAAHYLARSGFDYASLQRPFSGISGFPAYCVSKLANVLFTVELAERLQGTNVSAFCLHPGTVATDIWRTMPRPLQWVVHKLMKSSEDGAKTTIYCALQARAEMSGSYYDDCKRTRPAALAFDPAERRTLWDRSVAWTQAPDLPAR